MAIFHLSAKVISRKSGQSVIAKAAYNARAELTEERTGEVKDYTRAEGLLFSGIYTPANVPDWAHDRAKLWNAADRAERRKDAQLAREYEVALPHELTDEQRRYLVQDFIRENFTRKGYAADVSIHAPDRDGDPRNHHAHILVTDRRLEADGFAADKKERQQSKADMKAELEALRERWEKTTNRHLERHGHAVRIDRRSLKDQGVDREPTQHLGPYATRLERDGEPSERGDLNREIEARNAEREPAKREQDQTSQEQGQPEHAARERAEGEREAPASGDSTREEGTPEPTPEPAPEHGGLRVVDGATGLVSGVSAVAGQALDAMAGFGGKAIEGLAEGFAGLLGGGSTARREPDPEPSRPQKSLLQVLQERAAKERALRNLSQSIQRGGDINAADLRALPPVELERLRNGGDEYLKRLVQRWERERDDRGRERER